MSSFDILEQSGESSQPIEIYRIAVGALDPFLYTSAEDTISFDGDDYEPLPGLTRDSVVQGANERRRTLSITVPGTNEFAQQYIDIVPGSKATVTIIRLQRNESPTFDTSVLIFKGQVLSVSFPNDGAVAVIACRSIEAAASRQIPRWTFMGMCNHVLYDATSGCNADPDDPQFKLTNVVTVVDGNVLTVSGANSKPDGWWAGGFVSLNGVSDFRLILAHAGNNLVLLLPFAGDATGATAVLQAGCNHIFTGDCTNKFDRGVDYGGFFFVPTRNPFGGSGIV